MTNSMMMYLSLFLTTIPIIGLIFNASSTRNPKMGAQLATVAIGIGLTLSLILLGYSYGDETPIYFLGFKADSLGLSLIHI